MKKHIILYFLFLLFQINKTTGTTSVYFSPDDKPAEKLIQNINNTKKKIHAAIFIITNKKIEKALVEAKKRSVDVKIITDPGSLPTQYNRIKSLLENNVSVFTYNPKIPITQREFRDRMHNKFCILDQSVWTGSFNWTYFADYKNQENVIFTTKYKVVKSYEKQFEKIKKQRCETLTLKKLDELITIQQKQFEKKAYQEKKKQTYDDLKIKIKTLLKIIQTYGKTI